MSYANNGGVRIHFEVEGEGPALVLQHGFTESVQDWYEAGYVEALKSDYRLILIDARGHGASDKPHDPDAYALNRRVADVVAVLDALKIAKALFWGYSMGGWIGFGTAKYSQERFRALVIGGQHPYARSMEPLRQVVRRGISQGGEAFVVGMEEMFGPSRPCGSSGFVRRISGPIWRLLRTGPPSKTCLRPCRCRAASMPATWILSTQRSKNAAVACGG